MADNFIYIYAGLIILMAGFLAYNNFKIFKQARVLYKAQDLTKFKVIDVTRKWLLFYAVMFGFIVLLLLLGDQSMDVVIISIGLLIIVLAELGGTFIRFKLFYNEKNFIYETKIYRIKSVRTVNRTGKFMKRSEVVMFDGTKIQMPKVFADKLEELSKKK